MPTLILEIDPKFVSTSISFMYFTEFCVSGILF
jgi:hypothetical protein